jgi:ADP-heptose:LPS heptosyltransferase
MLGALGALRRKRPIPERLDRIGIMKSTGIGDMILATAGVRDIAEAFPDAEIVLFAGADNADLARLVPGVRVVELAASRPWRTLPRLRAERLDALIDLGQWTRLEALYAGLSGARWTAGFATPGQRRHYAYDATVSHSSDVRELDNFRRLVALLGLEPTSMPSFHPTRASDRPPPPVDGPYAVLHMWPGGYRSELREWPAPSWRTLAEIIGARGCSMVLTGGPGDVDRTAAFVASCDGLDLPLFPVAGRYRLHELVDVLATARCVVSVNTGVMHLAAATGAPTIALNGPTSSLRWGPVGPRAISLDSDFPGCGFLNLGSEYDGQRTDCMKGISVERVAAAVLEQIRD